MSEKNNTCAEQGRSIPSHWQIKKLGEVFTIERGGSPRPIEDFITNDENGINWIKIGDTKDVVKYIYRTKEKIKPEGAKRSRMVFEDDFLLSNSMSFGRPYIMKTTGCIHDGWLVIRKNENLDNNYLFYILSSNLLFQQFSNLAKGSTVKNLNIEAVKQAIIQYPPLPEQQLIVSRIEELLSDLENGKQQLLTAQQQLKVYRQSLLKWAFEGKLTENWRKQQPKLLSGEQILKQIKRERSDLGKLNKITIKPIQDISAEEINELPKLPKEIIWTRLGELIWSVKDGPHYSPKYQDKGIPFISGGNIRPNAIDFEKVKYISKELHEELSKRCKPEKLDLLYTKGGTTGIAKVNTYDIDFNVWVHVAVLKIVPSINPFYLQHALNSNHCYKQSQKYTHGVGNQDLGLTRMILITLPICSIEEQDQIVKELESKLTVCDKIEETISQSLLQAESLRQSILKKAFEGKLV